MCYLHPTCKVRRPEKKECQPTVRATVCVALTLIKMHYYFFANSSRRNEKTHNKQQTAQQCVLLQFDPIKRGPPSITHWHEIHTGRTYHTVRLCPLWQRIVVTHVLKSLHFFSIYFEPRHVKIVKLIVKEILPQSFGDYMDDGATILLRTRHEPLCYLCIHYFFKKGKIMSS